MWCLLLVTLFAGGGGGGTTISLAKPKVSIAWVLTAEPSTDHPANYPPLSLLPMHPQPEQMFPTRSIDLAQFRAQPSSILDLKTSKLRQQPLRSAPMPTRAEAGAVALSHSASERAKVSYRGLAIRRRL